MTKEQFLFQLEQLLVLLPQEEREEALAYYRDYFNDAGPENEAAVIAELGTPEKVAASIREGLQPDMAGEAADTVAQPPGLKDSVSGRWKRAGRSHTDARSKWILMILVAVFTFPVWIGVAGTAFGLIVAAIVTMLGICVAVAAVSVAGLLGGLVSVVVGIIRLAAGGLVSGLMTFGLGMLLIAVGCLCTILMVLLFGKFVPWMLRSISDLLHNGRKRRREARVHEAYK